MKDIKTLLLGIALILFGIFCMEIVQDAPSSWLSFGVFLPFIGLAVCFIAMFMKDDSQ